jgi:hypothetical protein
MNLYTYVAANNPYFVKSLAHKYGHELKKDPNLSFVLEQLVAMHGEQALTEIINVHPDKDLFKDFYSIKTEEIKVNASGDSSKNTCGCGCGKCCKNNNNQEYLNISGSEMFAKNKEVITNTNLMVFAGAIVIAFAILNLKN